MGAGRVDEYKIEGTSDRDPTTAAARKRAKATPIDQLKANAAESSTTYSRVPITPRDPHIYLPFDHDVATPYKIFKLFISGRNLDAIAEHTNTTAEKWFSEHPRSERKPNSRKWRPTNGQEMGIWLGLHLLMGLDHTPSVAAFWRQSTGRSIYPNI